MQAVIWYAAISDTRACIADAEAEFYRKIQAVYEAEAEKRSGDVD